MPGVLWHHSRAVEVPRGAPVMIEIDLKVKKADFELRAELKMPDSGVTAVFGPSGSGKTTLLRTIAGLERHEGCKVSIGGETWRATKPSAASSVASRSTRSTGSTSTR